MSRRFLSIACAIVLVCLVEALGGAQGLPLPDRRTFFTFSAPVTVPGATLPPGKYLFRIANPETSSRVVQVLSPDGTMPYAAFFTVPAERLEAPNDPEVRFMETAPGTPPAIASWWYPTERTGFEFVYPKDQARRLAQGKSEPVLTTQAETTTTQQTNTRDLARISSTGESTNVNPDAKPKSANPTGAIQRGEIAPASIVIAVSVQ
jgi:hypothetical protein